MNIIATHTHKRNYLEKLSRYLLDYGILIDYRENSK